MSDRVSICAVIQNDGKMLAQGLLFAASLRKHGNDKFDVFLCCPKNSDKWSMDVEVTDPEVLSYFEKIGVKVNFFDNAAFGSAYPHSNKAYAFATLPASQPFIFFDTDYLFLDDLSDLDFNFDNPDFIRGPRSWPPLNRSQHSLDEIWGDIYAALGVDTAVVYRQEHKINDWERYTYFNASLIYFKDPQQFSAIYLDNMKKIWALDTLKIPHRFLYPQLDQIVLPATLAMLGIKPKIYRFQHKRRLRWLHYHDFPFLYYYRKDYDFIGYVRTLLEEDLTLAGILRGIPEFSHYFSAEADSALRKESCLWEGDVNLRHIKDDLLAKGHWYQG